MTPSRSSPEQGGNLSMTPLTERPRGELLLDLLLRALRVTDEHLNALTVELLAHSAARCKYHPLGTPPPPTQQARPRARVPPTPTAATARPAVTPSGRAPLAIRTRWSEAHQLLVGTEDPPRQQLNRDPDSKSHS